MVTKEHPDPDVTLAREPRYWAAVLAGAFLDGNLERLALARRRLLGLGLRVDIRHARPGRPPKRRLSGEEVKQ